MSSHPVLFTIKLVRERLPFGENQEHRLLLPGDIPPPKLLRDLVCRGQGWAWPVWELRTRTCAPNSRSSCVILDTIIDAFSQSTRAHSVWDRGHERVWKQHLNNRPVTSSTQERKCNFPQKSRLFLRLNLGFLTGLSHHWFFRRIFYLLA